MTRLAELTTMRVGGEPASLVRVTDRQQVIDACLELWRAGEDWLLLGGGSNLVVADEVPQLHVIQVANLGVEYNAVAGTNQVLVRAQSGENWDNVVAQTIARGLAGLEGLSGIPGSVGAAPVQNIGAYGQEVSDTLQRIEFLDYETHEVQIMSVAELELGYRDSALKRGRLGAVLWVEFLLTNHGGLSAPISSTQLASALNVEMGAQVDLARIRDAVLELRAAKGMLLDALDPNSVSCGSFFTNPIVSDTFARTLDSAAPRWETPDNDGLTVKLSAAWLIEQAGIPKGFKLPGSAAAISDKHTLAITNRGGATAAQILELAEYVQVRVANTFGVALVPEPNLVGF
ncbi:MAG: UDP-N-acetylmuramate dehydrogenase [Micrococcales bacterium]